MANRTVVVTGARGRQRVTPPAWWQTAVIYEVYPRSFADASGDGIGDLAGITSRLDYLASTLGVDAIWIGPFYPSPMADFGYDVTDFTGVDPRYGTLDDFDTLIREAHDRGLRVIVDYIPNHTSDQHPWFTESRSSRDSPKRDWYVWADPAPGGGPPSNWTSEMGGSTWQSDAATGQYYLHSFHPRQPDLNWRSPALRQAMLEALGFWLRRGTDGIRIDVAHLLAKHPRFADNPVREQPLRNLTDRQHPDYDTQEHINDRLQPEVHRYLAMIRRVLDRWSRRTGRARIAIAEVEALPWHTWSRFFGQRDDGVHLPFNFGLIEADWSPPALAASIEGQEAALPAGAWPNYVLQNHDRPRLATRLGPEHARTAAMLLLTLRGTPTLYYGEELGLADLRADPSRWLDPLGRDESRAPMPWTPAPGGGFSTSPRTESWLPPYPDLSTVSVEAQRGDPRSMLNLYRNLIACRRATPALLAGSYQTAPHHQRLPVLPPVHRQPAGVGGAQPRRHPRHDRPSPARAPAAGHLLPRRGHAGGTAPPAAAQRGDRRVPPAGRLQRGVAVSQVAILARVTVKEGKAEQYLAAFAPLLEQAREEPGTLLYALHRSKDDPHVFWTTEIYTDNAAFAAHGASDVHAAAAPVFTELIARADVMIGETLMVTGLGG